MVVEEESGFAYKYLLGTDKENPDNRIACIEKTPRVQIINGFGWTPEGTTRCTNDDSIKSFWIYGDKGSDCYDSESHKWCEDVLKALYPDSY